MLRSQGYDGRYLNKSGNQREGLATFWRTGAFSLEAQLGGPVRDLFGAGAAAEPLVVPFHTSSTASTSASA